VAEGQKRECPRARGSEAKRLVRRERPIVPNYAVEVLRVRFQPRKFDRVSVAGSPKTRFCRQEFRHHRTLYLRRTTAAGKPHRVLPCSVSCPRYGGAVAPNVLQVRTR